MTALVMTQVRPGRVSVTTPPARAVRRTSSPVADGPLRLTSRGRVVLVGLALLVAAVGLFTWQAGQASADGPSGAVEVVRHVVQPGETLWGIARDVAGPREDVRDVVMELVELNGLPSAGLMAGQSIIVPAT